MVLGARPYLAPERLDGADDGTPGDVYALGCPPRVSRWRRDDHLSSSLPPHRHSRPQSTRYR